MELLHVIEVVLISGKAVTGAKWLHLLCLHSHQATQSILMLLFKFMCA